jgi:hypothetical protein
MESYSSDKTVDICANLRVHDRRGLKFALHGRRCSTHTQLDIIGVGQSMRKDAFWGRRAVFRNGTSPPSLNCRGLFVAYVCPRREHLDNFFKCSNLFNCSPPIVLFLESPPSNMLLSTARRKLVQGAPSVASRSFSSSIQRAMEVKKLGVIGAGQMV